MDKERAVYLAGIFSLSVLGDELAVVGHQEARVVLDPSFAKVVAKLESNVISVDRKLDTSS